MTSSDSASANASLEPGTGGGWGKPFVNLDLGRKGGPSRERAEGESRELSSVINSRVTSSLFK